MFEDYLEDAHYLSTKASEVSDDKEARRYYRASVFYAISAIEAFINYIGDASAQGEVLEPFEIALLTDKKFGLSKDGCFAILEPIEYHRLEDKIRFLLSKANSKYDFLSPDWSRFVEFKRLRDAITHPRNDKDEISTQSYRKTIQKGLGATIKVMNEICKGIFGRPLRKRVIELSS
jgi:hypothetical protein